MQSKQKETDDCEDMMEPWRTIGVQSYDRAMNKRSKTVTIRREMLE